MGFLLIWNTFASTLDGDKTKKFPKVAIIGGGLGGGATAHFLRDIFDGNVEIDVYEPGGVGGRLTTVKIGNEVYEAGGTMIHPRNQYMQTFTDDFNLKKRARPSYKMGLFNGEELVFKESNWNLVNLAHIMWRYGMSSIRLESWLHTMLTLFDRIYSHQKHGYAFSDVKQLLSSMHPQFYNMTTYTSKTLLKDKGMSSLFVDEFVLAAIRTNYGQDTFINSFVGFVSMAGVEKGLWAVENGNNQIPKLLVEKSGAKVILEKVTKIELKDDDKWRSLYTLTTTDDSGVVNTHEYDQVIIATPLTDDMSSIEFDDKFRPPIKKDPGSYHRTVVTFVQGWLNKTNLGCDLSDKSCKDVELFLTCNKSLFYSSVGQQVPINYDPSKPIGTPVYKVFSKEPLSKDQLDFLFISFDTAKTIDMKAYPKYQPPEFLPQFVLHRNMFYVNAIERAASAMEMVAIGAKNVALLSYYNWKRGLGKVDVRFTHDHTHTEL